MSAPWQVISSRFSKRAGELPNKFIVITCLFRNLDAGAFPIWQAAEENWKEILTSPHS